MSISIKGERMPTRKKNENHILLTQILTISNEALTAM